MFRLVVLLLGVCVTALITAPAVMAAGGDLITNGDFTTSLAGWTASGAVQEDLTMGVPPGSAKVENTQWALLTQVVMQDGYNYASTSVQYDLKAYVQIQGTEDIEFKLGYFNSIFPPPTPAQTPDNLIILGDETTPTFGFVPVKFSGTINADPKYLSVRVEYNPDLNPTADCAAWVDAVSFSAFSKSAGQTTRGSRGDDAAAWRSRSWSTRAPAQASRKLVIIKNTHCFHHESTKLEKHKRNFKNAFPVFVFSCFRG